MTKCSASSLVSFNSDHFVVRNETYLVWQVDHDFPDGSLDIHFSVISTDAPAAWTSGSASVERPSSHDPTSCADCSNDFTLMIIPITAAEPALTRSRVFVRRVYICLSVVFRWKCCRFLLCNSKDFPPSSSRIWKCWSVWLWSGADNELVYTQIEFVWWAGNIW